MKQSIWQCNPLTYSQLSNQMKIFQKVKNIEIDNTRA